MTFEQRKKRTEKMLKDSIGYDYVTTKEVAHAMGYKSETSARQYTYGCRKYGSRYYLPEVAEKIARSGVYEV